MGADWGLTNTVRDALYARKAVPLRFADELRLLALRLHPQSDDFRALLVHGDEERTRMTALRFSAGVLGADTDAHGIAYGKLVDAVTITASGGRTFTFAASGNTLTASSGDWRDDGYRVGMAVAIAGTSSNNATRTITSLSATVMTFASGVADEGPLSATANVSATWSAVEFYAEQARSTLVSAGIVADGASGSFAAEAGYALAGTIAVGTISADLEFAALLDVPAYRQVDDVYDGSAAFPDDAQNSRALKQACDAARASLLQAANAFAAAAAAVQRSAVRRLLVSRSSETVLIDPRVRQSATGQVDKRPIGLLEDERAAQEANTAGDGAITFGSGTHAAVVTFASGWTGRDTGPTLNKRAVPGTISLVCVQTLTDRPPRFDVFFDPDDTRRKPDDGRATIRAAQQLVLGATYRAIEFGVESFLLDYEPTVANDGGDTTLDTTASYWSVVGLRASNSDAGKLYTYYDHAATLLEVYRTEAGRDARDSAQLVTQAVLSGNSTAFVSEDTGLGLILSGRSGTRQDTDKGEIDFNVPSETQPAARLTIAVSQTVDPSRWLELVRDGAIGGTPGAPTQTSGGWEVHTGTPVRVSDGLILRGHALGGARLFRRRV